MVESDRGSARILVVDDDPANVRLLERLLHGAGFPDVTGTTDARQALSRYRSTRPDLVMLDLMMPHVDGLTVLAQLRAEIGDDDYVPIVILTADATLEAKRRALGAGATDFLTKPFEHFEILLRVRNLLSSRRLYLEVERHNRSLEATVRERTERLLQSEKVATMGSLLAGVAHELNNPLAALSGQAQLLREEATDPQVVRRADKIFEASDRCVRIVRNFLALARQQQPERGRVGLNEVVRGAVELLAYELKTDSVEVVLDLGTDLPVLWADQHQFHQVLVNLLANAHYAVRRHTSPRRISVTTRYEPHRNRVRLEIVDSGPGMAPDVKEKVFQPFFTTKPVGEGTGLGLSLCRGMIDEHGGTIKLESEPGQGCRAVIELPAVTPPETAGSDGDANALPASRRGAILVVDDEQVVAQTLADALRLDGHETAIAGNGAVALDMLAKDQYDLIVSDSKMPVLDGEAFYDELSRRFPALRERVIFVTGDLLSREKREFLAR
ncbi:MAG: hypothetical protein DMD81_00005, partial [Candidatus Rokuibacteriota bacterium]